MVHAQHYCKGWFFWSLRFFQVIVGEMYQLYVVYLECLLRVWFLTNISKPYPRHLTEMIYFWILVAMLVLILVVFGVDNRFTNQRDHADEWEGDSLAVLQGIIFLNTTWR